MYKIFILIIILKYGSIGMTKSVYKPSGISTWLFWMCDYSTEKTNYNKYALNMRLDIKSCFWMDTMEIGFT